MFDPTVQSSMCICPQITHVPFAAPETARKLMQIMDSAQNIRSLADRYHALASIRWRLRHVDEGSYRLLLDYAQNTLHDRDIVELLLAFGPDQDLVLQDKWRWIEEFPLD